MNLYPFGCEYFKFRLGHSKIQVGDKCQDKQAMLSKEGLIRCTFMPPADSNIPSYDSDVKQFFFYLYVMWSPTSCHLLTVYILLFPCLIFLSFLVASFTLQILYIFNTANHLKQFSYCSYTWNRKEDVVRVFPDFDF